jgi:hypothetical protein
MEWGYIELDMDLEAGWPQDVSARGVSRTQLLQAVPMSSNGRHIELNDKFR